MAQTFVKTISLNFTVITHAGETLCIDFYAVPELARRRIGEVIVEWGDGSAFAPPLTIDDGTLNEMVDNELLEGIVHFTHTYAEDGKRTISIKAPYGLLPLKSLPYQTISIDSPLPTLTVGETDDKFAVVASDTLPRIACAGSPDGKGLLTQIHSDLLISNSQLEYFDESFMHTRLKAVPAGLFSPCVKLTSLVRTFAHTPVAKIEALTLAPACEPTDCQETFAHCSALESVENPFREGIWPVCLENFLQGAPSSLFTWSVSFRREEMGWMRPSATQENPSFDFDWLAPDSEKATIATFYPIDLELNGNLYIEWGDGTNETVDWNRTHKLEHAYPAAGLWHIKMHYTPREAVRPFYLGVHTQAIHTALPLWHPKTVESRGDFAGWAADLRELETIAVPLFVNNPDIVNLEQAFAGCVKLKDVPHDMLSGIRHARVDGMFAFCKSMKQLPTSYTVLERDTTLDCFYPQLI